MKKRRNTGIHVSHDEHETKYDITCYVFFFILYLNSPYLNALRGVTDVKLTSFYFSEKIRADISTMLKAVPKIDELFTVLDKIGEGENTCDVYGRNDFYAS